METGQPSQLPPSFRSFCAANGINENVYQLTRQLPRYIRFRESPSADVIGAVSEQLGVKLEPVQWLPGFFTLPQDVKIAASEAYRKGQIFGIDASSGAAVVALDVQPGDHVLDLCAAPGAKLCLVADQLKLSGTATGVDISRPRLAATRTLLRKYGASHNCRLFLADGTTFRERPPTNHVAEKGSQKVAGGNAFETRPPVDHSGLESRQTVQMKGSDGSSSGEEGGSESAEGKRSDELRGPEADALRSVYQPEEVVDHGRNCGFGKWERESPVVDKLRAEERETQDAGFVPEPQGIGEPYQLHKHEQAVALMSKVGQAVELQGSKVGENREARGPQSAESGESSKAGGLQRAESGASGEACEWQCAKKGEVGEIQSVKSGVLREACELRDAKMAAALQADGHHKKHQRKPTGGRESEPHLFFFGRGITPPALEAANGLGTAALYDKVLVDAECTHDGSLKHIQKYDWWGWDSFERRVMDPQRLASITDLQGRLLRNGFRLLKKGGTLVYSTCSFTKAQNEEVVSAFLDAHPDAELILIPLSATWPCSSGGLRHTLRFDPVLSKTGGLFIAKFVKHLD